MSQTNSVAVDGRDLSIWKQVRKWIMPSDGVEAKTALVFSDSDTPQEIAKKLLDYSIESYAMQGHEAAVAALDKEDDTSYIIEPRYDEHQLTILEDCYISDVVAHKLVNKLKFTVIGKHGRTVLDTRKEFSTEKERAQEIQSIMKNKKFQNIKTRIDDIFTQEDFSFHENLGDLFDNWCVFGRACFYIQKDDSGMWQTLILLDSKRLGRVKVDKTTRKITHVEYQDVEENDDGTLTPAIEVSNAANLESQSSAQFLPIEDLIYVVNKAGGIGKNTRYVGYSIYEPIVHISQIKRIVLNKNLKEAAETHYMGFGRYQFDPNTPDSIITNFINSVKGATGKYFGHKIPVQAHIEKIPVDLEKFNDVVDLLNREMIRTSGLASFLFGYEQIANYANSEQVNLASRDLDIAYLKTLFKDIIAHKVLNPLVKILSGQDDKGGNKDTLPSTPTSKLEPAAAAEMDDDEEKPTTKEADENFIKITYEFQDINFNTKKETAEMLKIAKELVPAIPDEAVLRALGLDDWVEETLAEAEKRDKERKEQFANGNFTPENDNGSNQNKPNNFNNKSGNNFNKPATATQDEGNPLVVEAQLDLIAAAKRMLLKEKDNDV